MENVWDKAQADALVWHTDAYYWSKKEGDFDEQTADDFDVDFSEQFGYGTWSPGPILAYPLSQSTGQANGLLLLQVRETVEHRR